MTEKLQAIFLRTPNFVQVLAAPVSLLLLNIYVCADLFAMEYSAHLDSIEAAYISISNYIVRHGFGLDWFPEWYGGIPFQNSYPPLLHFLVAEVARLFHISVALAHHMCAAGFYCFGPLALYFLVSRLSGSRARAFAAGLVYTLFAPSIVLTATARTWTNSIWDPSRLFTTMKFGDSPHVSALALVPLALLALERAITLRSAARIAIAAMAFAAVVLTNWLGAFALALATLSYLLAILVTRGDWRHAVKTSIYCAVFAYALIAALVPPSTIGRVRYNAQYVIGQYPMGVRQILYVVPLLLFAAIIFFCLRWIRASVLTCFASFLSFFCIAIVLMSEKAGVALMPQPERYHLEIDLAVSLVIVSGFVMIWRYAPRRISLALFGMLLIALPFQIVHAHSAGKTVLKSVDIRSTVEYELANWLRDHIGEKRVFISGSTQFWLNAFTDTPQIGGGFGQGIVNSQIPVLHYGVPWTEKDGLETALWLRLYGVSAVVVSDTNGRDAYHFVWRDAKKFEGVLPELFRDGGDTIFAVPQRSDSLAHVIEAKDVVRRSPINNIDFDPVRSLSAALENPLLPTADFRWINKDAASIHVQLKSDQLLYVQVSYHAGFHAEVNGAPVPIRRDGLGQMVLEPRCSGDCLVRLIYDGGSEMKIAKVISSLTSLGVLGILAYSLFRNLTVRFRRKRGVSAIEGSPVLQP